MNPATVAARLVFLAKQARGEADRHAGTIRNELIARSRQLTYAFPQAYSTDPEVQRQAVALIEATIDCLVDVVSARTERELTKGTP